VTRTALLVESGKTLSQSLLLGARNLKGVELVLNNEVHPYDLLRYERAIFSKAAIEQIAEMLEKNASKRDAGRKIATAETEAA
jgi:large subunit ribosomal protein L4